MAASSAQALAGTAAPGTPELVADALAGGQARRGAAGSLSLLGLAFRRHGGRSAAAQLTAPADRDAQEARAVPPGLTAAFVPRGHVYDAPVLSYTFHPPVSHPPRTAPSRPLLRSIRFL